VSGPTTIVHRDLIIALAACYACQRFTRTVFFVNAGNLMTYATDLIETIRQECGLWQRKERVGFNQRPKRRVIDDR
jgi:hypothetical protein